MEASRLSSSFVWGQWDTGASSGIDTNQSSGRTERLFLEVPPDGRLQSLFMAAFVWSLSGMGIHRTSSEWETQWWLLIGTLIVTFFVVTVPAVVRRDFVTCHLQPLSGST